MKTEISQLIISKNASLVAALNQMDKIGHKLLMIADDDKKLEGLVTIGDIQRAIIANSDLQSPISIFIGRELIIATINDDMFEIKKNMLSLRLEYMPILNTDNSIEKIIFWDEIINDQINLVQNNLDMPVVIMAGGFGTRLKPLTNVIPKPLLPYGDTTIIENIISRFQRCGCNEFMISVNYKADFIKFYFDNISNKNYSVSLFSEPSPLGTAGSLSLLREKLNKPFFVSNCDILIEQDYSEIYEYHKAHKNELTLVASLKQYNIPYGTLESGNNGELMSLKEKPDLNFMINCGMYILEPHLLSEIPENTFFHITHLIERIKERGGKVGVFPISEKSWVDIGEWQFYAKVLMG